MNDRQQDTDLRAHFDAQREAEAREAPLYADVIARARAEAAAAPVATSHAFRARRLLYVSGLAAAAVIAALLIIPRQDSSEDAFEQTVRAFHNNPALGGWQSPTDGLLNVPGSQLISTVPSVGVN